MIGQYGQPRTTEMREEVLNPGNKVIFLALGGNMPYFDFEM